MARHDTDGSSALAPNDPYNDMDGADIRPNFQVIDGGKSNSRNTGRDNSKIVDFNKAKQQRQNGSASKDLLRNSENSALTGNEPTFGENSPWKNNVSGRGADNKKPSKGKGGFLKQKKGIAAMAIILSLVAGGGAFLGSSHSLLAPAMESLMTEATDTQHASWTLRTMRLFNYNNHGSSNVTKKYGDIPTGAQTKSQQGRVATFFDNMATKIYNKLGLSRNIFNDFKQSGNSDTDMENFRNTMEPEYDSNSSTVRGAHDETREVQETDADGNPQTNPDGSPKTKTETVTVNETELDGRSNGSMDEATQKANNFVNSTAGKVAQVASQVGNAACAVMRVGATISAVVAANEIYQSINYFMNYMENVSKMKYGEGSNSAINEVLNTLTTPVDATFPNVNNVSGGGANESVTGAPVQANGMQMMLAYAPANSNTNKNFSIERTGNAIASALGMSAAAVQTCAGVQAGAAVVSIVTTISTLGVSAIGQVLFNIALSATISVTASIALSFIVPTIAKTLFTNIFETTTGIPAGELLARGSSAANTRVGRSGSGQSLSSSEVATTYSRVSQEVIAMEAEADRQNRSPFDITSKNTFLGSIVYNLLPITLFSAKTSTALITNVNTLTRATSSAISSITNSASAASSNSYMANFGDCPNLDAIGAVGDIYCNPITSTDPTLIDMDPNNDTYINTIKAAMVGDDCDSEGNCTIDPKKDLAKYISYCDNRDSPFGIVDANILGNLETGNAVLGAIPLIGDVLDILNSARTAENLKWATGEKCVNTASNSDWGKFKYYQRYIEDQRILDWAGAYGDGQSPVLAYETQYEKEHPLDNSPAGYLARISGITKDDAEFVIALAEYYNFLEEYDSSTRLAIGEYSPTTDSNTVIAKLEAKHPPFESKNNPNLTYVAFYNQPIIYNDTRNRSYAV